MRIKDMKMVKKSEQRVNHKESVNRCSKEKLVQYTTEIENDVVGSLVEVETSRDIDMMDDDVFLKTQTLKRKLLGREGGKNQNKERTGSGKQMNRRWIMVL